MANSHKVIKGQQTYSDSGAIGDKNQQVALSCQAKEVQQQRLIHRDVKITSTVYFSI